MPHLASPKTDAVRDRMSDIRSVKTYQSPHHPTSLFQAVTTIGGLLACYAVLFTGMSPYPCRAAAASPGQWPGNTHLHAAT